MTAELSSMGLVSSTHAQGPSVADELPRRTVQGGACPEGVCALSHTGAALTALMRGLDLYVVGPSLQALDQHDTQCGVGRLRRLV